MPTISTIPALVLIMILAWFTWTAGAAQITVIKTDDTQITGDLLRQDSTGLTLRLADTTIPLRINKDEIREIRDTPTIAQQYRQRRTQLKDEDVQGRYDLAKWLYDQRALEMARRELLDLRRISPDDDRVKLLLNAVEEQLKASAAIAAAQQQQTATAPAGGTSDPAGTASVTTNAKAETPITRLTPEQINVIRIYEYDSQARPPLRVQVPGEVFDALFSNYREDPAVIAILRQTNGPNLFRSKSGNEVLEFLFQRKARELYDKVRVLDDPPALRTFRTQIHQSYVLNYCATDRCHGGNNAASRSYYLFRNNPWEDATAYTNFYLLHAYEKDTMRMIDRSRPDDSLLIQYGLPRQEAKVPHPNTGGWQPHPGLSGTASLRQTLVSWMSNELLPEKMLPSGTYPITYSFPHGEPSRKDSSATSAPTTATTMVAPQ